MKILPMFHLRHRRTARPQIRQQAPRLKIRRKNTPSPSRRTGLLAFLLIRITRGGSDAITHSALRKSKQSEERRSAYAGREFCERLRLSRKRLFLLVNFTSRFRRSFVSRTFHNLRVSFGSELSPSRIFLVLKDNLIPLLRCYYKLT